MVTAAYFPVFFHHFSLKNDALVYFLPVRHQVSIAIREGHFAWWSDAIYLGTPLYSDIQSGAWNPLVLLLSLFGKYNMSMLETELSIYLLAAAFGMYKLTGRFTDSPLIRLIIALSYTCSGFMTDSGSFIPWMNAAAILPYLFFFFIRLLEFPSWRSTIPFTLSAFLLLTAGYPSFLVYTGYLLAAILLCLLFRYRKKWKTIRPVLLHLLLFLFLTILLWSPVVYAWIDYFPYYQRGSAVPLSFARINPFPRQGFLSLLTPSALTPGNEWLNTDVSMRNISFGLFACLLLPLSLRNSLKSRILKTIAVVAVISLLISMGDVTPVHKWCYQLLPFFDRFRHPGTLRLFFIIGVLLISASSFEQLVSNESKTGRNARLIAWMALLILLLLTGIGFFNSGVLHHGLREAVRNSLRKPATTDLLLIQGLVQIFFICIFLYLTDRKKNRFLPYLVAAQVITAAWIALPLTFISKTHATTIDQEIEMLSATKSPHLSIDSMRHTDREKGPDASSVIQPSFYDNRPVFNHDIVSPTVSTRYLRFLNDTAKKRFTTGLPWAFYSATTQYTGSLMKNNRQHNTTEAIELLHKKQGSLLFRIDTRQNGYLYVFEQYHHRWEVQVNGKKSTVQQADDAFIAVPVTAGINSVELRFNPGRTQLVLGYTCLIVFSGLLLSVLGGIRRSKKQENTVPEKKSDR